MPTEHAVLCLEEARGRDPEGAVFAVVLAYRLVDSDYQALSEAFEGLCRRNPILLLHQYSSSIPLEPALARMPIEICDGQTCTDAEEEFVTRRAQEPFPFQ